MRSALNFEWARCDGKVAAAVRVRTAARVPTMDPSATAEQLSPGDSKRMNATTLRRGGGWAAPSTRETGDGAVFLILGPPADPLATAVADTLRASGRAVRQMDHPFAAPHRCSWWLDVAESEQELLLDDGGRLSAARIGGVFVRGQPTLDREGWAEKDLGYAHAELHAAVLGWLHGLSCPVVNRFPSWTWFRRGPRLSDWYPALRLAGVPFQDAVLTNDMADARAFGDALVLNPMTAEPAYLLAGEDDWRLLSEYLTRAPAVLTRPHGAPTFATVIGAAVVWSEVPDGASELEHALLRFSRITGLAFLEVAFAPVDGAIRAVAIDAFPSLDHQPDSNRGRIVRGLVSLLTGQTAAAPAGRLP